MDNLEDINDIVNVALEKFLLDGAGESSRNANEEYLKSFRLSSFQKAKVLLGDIKRHGLNEDNVIYASIGSAECYEFDYLVENSRIRRFLAFDVSHIACEGAWDRLRKRVPPREMTILSGDAITNTAELHGYLDELLSSKDDVVVMSIQGLLHELVTREVDEISDFLHTLSSRYERLLFQVREPCRPVNIPSYVYLKFCGLDSKVLMRFARTVSDHLLLPSHLELDDELGLKCSGRLAIEVVIKLFYIRDFTYEMGETITSVDPFRLVEILHNIPGNGTVNYNLFNSNSFYQQFADYVELRSTSGNSLPMPLTFVRALFSKGLSPSSGQY